jgi:cell division septation protein DedD
MENKNIMLVIASISLFFVIIVGVGLWLFWPKGAGERGAESAAARPLFDGDFDSFEFYKSDEEIPGLMEEKPEDELKEMTLTVGEATDKMTIEKKEAEVKPSTKAEGAKVEAPPQIPAKTTPSKRVTPTVAKKTTPPAPRKVYIKEYEIQVGSYKTRSRAESINDRLKNLGLAGSIRTRQVGSSTYYRVRIGPYSSQGEAAKFLTWLRDVEGLEDSYISQVTRQKTIN